MNQLTAVRIALDHLKTGENQARPASLDRHSQRYRITDRFTADELAAIIARYEGGEYSTNLAKEHDIAKSTLLRLLVERGVEVRTRGLTTAKEEEIIRLRRQGMIIRDIAKRVGCSYDTARKFLL
ncbi:hypothetical protein [Arthrobacter roseus]|uniref:hypothetical protein n=1 Tax=Arthrobacter roseus TaxID=136274 RepID=UPI001962BE2E|nr:hypothetical protein [Arthrobacter roseus]MBM7849603.1 transposase [Arthrobacter roseus]